MLLAVRPAVDGNQGVAGQVGRGARQGVAVGGDVNHAAGQVQLAKRLKGGLLRLDIEVAAAYGD